MRASATCGPENDAPSTTPRVAPKPRVERYERAESIGWALPMDDTSFRVYVAGRVRELVARTSRAYDKPLLYNASRGIE
ncbi:MAG: hypothetical protein EXR70_00640 [Deltaproteobacteria bacterium]|nr:hypothetical protein [Deltaproteobacteria bacterium]